MAYESRDCDLCEAEIIRDAREAVAQNVRGDKLARQTIKG
jgi:hypothetical protein